MDNYKKLFEKYYVRKGPSSLLGLYYGDDYEQLLPDEYNSIDILNTEEYDSVRLFHVKVHSTGKSCLFVHSQLGFGYHLFELQHCFKQVSLIDITDESALRNDVIGITEVLYLLKCFFDDESSLLGSFVYADHLLCLEVPVQYDKIVYGNNYIAARNIRNSDSQWSFYLRHGKRIKDSCFASPNSVDLHAAVNSITFGQHEPLPIIGGKVTMMNTETVDYIAPSPNERIDIALKNDRFGLFKDAYYRILDFRYDSVVPNTESYPLNFEKPGCHTFSIEMNRKWGVFDFKDNRITIPCILDDKLTVVSKVKSFDHGYTSTTPISFICSYNQRQGIIGRNGEVLIPFEYNRIESHGYVIEEGGEIRSSCYYFCWKDQFCSVFTETGKFLFDGLITEIDSISVIEPEERDAYGYFNGEESPFFVCRLGNTYGLFSENGQLYPCIYDNIFFDSKEEHFRLIKDRNTEYYSPKKHYD